MKVLLGSGTGNTRKETRSRLVRINAINDERPGTLLSNYHFVVRRGSSVWHSGHATEGGFATDCRRHISWNGYWQTPVDYTPTVTCRKCLEAK